MREFRLFLLTGLSVAFACLLFAGAPRLIATDAEEEAMPPMRVHQAYLCSMGAAEDARQGHSGAREAAAERRAVRPCEAGRLGLCSAVAARSDANGNVLGHRSYLHTVYRAFALGDGFA